MIKERIRKLESKMCTSEKKVSLGEFGYATLSEVREMMAAVAARGSPFEIRETVEERPTGKNHGCVPGARD